MTTPSSQTIRQVIHDGTEQLARSGVDAPRLSAEVLVAHHLGLDRLAILIDQERGLDRDQVEGIAGLLRRRAGGEPVAYITGIREFYGLSFHVDPRVLIPRPETELIVEMVKDTFGPGRLTTLADVCTGSGVLGIALATQFPELCGVLTDVSCQALDLARINAVRHGVDSRLACVCTDVMAGLRMESMDCIVANPPYIPGEVLDQISREVRCFEPAIALDGGPCGLKISTKLLHQASWVLKPGGWLFMEIEDGQFQPLLREMQVSADVWQSVALTRDYQHLERVVVAHKMCDSSTECGRSETQQT